MRLQNTRTVFSALLLNSSSVYPARFGTSPELSWVPVLERSLGRNGILSSYNEIAHIGTVWGPSTVAFSGRDAANGLRKYSSLRKCLCVISVEAHAAIVG